jgi:type II secretory pathway pseudopilin PulG
VTTQAAQVVAKSDRFASADGSALLARSARRRTLARGREGFALIDVIFVAGMIALLCSIAIPKLLLAKQAAGSSSAIGSLRAINSAELTYAITCGSGFYAPDLTTLGTVPAGSNQPFIGGGLGNSNTVEKSGYVFQLSGTTYPGAPPTCNGLAAGAAAQGFKAGADPADPTNPRYFSTNAGGLMYEDVATLFALTPEIGAPPTGHPVQR